MFPVEGRELLGLVGVVTVVGWLRCLTNILKVVKAESITGIAAMP